MMTKPTCITIALLKRLLQGNVSQVNDMVYGPLVLVPFAEINNVYVNIWTCICNFEYSNVRLDIIKIFKNQVR